MKPYKWKEFALQASGGAVLGAGIACCLVAIGVGLNALGAALSAQVPTERFTVVSQQFLDSGAKAVVIKDTATGKCYGLYEAGMAASLGEMRCQ